MYPNSPNTYIYIYIYRYVNMLTHSYMYMYTHVCIYIYIYICTYVYAQEVLVAEEEELPGGDGPVAAVPADVPDLP